MNNDYDREDAPAPHQWTLDEQIEINEELNEIYKRVDALVERVYLMGYTKSLLHNQNK